MQSPFKIQNLRQLASFALDYTDYQPADSARVRAVPDVRTIRYYTTLGLIDRPAEMRGRTAMYRLRHVEQLVAIKRLQSEGMTLSDIQRRLIGIPAKELAKLANLPKGLLKKFSAAQPGTLPATALAEEESQVPAPSSPPNQPADEPWKQVPTSLQSAVSASSVGSQHIVRLSLGPNVSIDVEVSDHEANQLDLDALRQSAEPLLREIRRQQNFLNRQLEGEVSQ